MNFSDITHEQKEYILENWNKESYSSIGKKISLSPRVISNFCTKNGLRKRPFKFKGNKENLLIIKYPDVAKEWNFELNKDININEVPYGSKVKIWWNCPVGHEPYLATISHRTLSNSGCPICARQYKSSFPEQSIYFYIKKVFEDATSAHVFNDIEYLEGDIYIPSLNLAIEYDGERFHRNKAEKDEYKNRVFNEKKIKLIRVREPKLPVLKEYESIIFKRKDYKSYSSLDDVIEKIFKVILELYKERISIDQINKIKEIIGCINVSKDKGQILQNLKFKLIKNSVYEWFPELMDEWNEPLIDPKTISKHNDLPIQWKCRTCDHEWTAVLKSRTGKVKAGCPKCSGNEKYTYEEVTKAFDLKNYILISKEYKNALSYLYYKCKKHITSGKMKVKFAEFIQSENPCKHCRNEVRSKNMIKYNIDDIRKEFKERGFELISEEYLGIHHNLEFICSEHKERGVQTVQYGNFQNIITPCKPCSRENAKNTEKENKIILKRAKELHYSDVSFSLNRRNKEPYISFVCNNHKNGGKQKISRNYALHGDFSCKFCSNAEKN